MHYFHYTGNRLCCEGVAVQTLARKFGTPLYVYSQRTLEEHFKDLDQALAGVEHLVCFAVKSNSNLSVLRALAPLFGEIVITEVKLSRAEKAEMLAGTAGAGAMVVRDAKKALAFAKRRAGRDGLVVVAGSIYLLSELFGKEKIKIAQ